MAALYGRLQGNRGEATRMGSASSGIHSKLETWNGSIMVELQADGSFEVWIGDKSYPSHTIATGNVDDRVATLNTQTDEYAIRKFK